MFLMYVYGTCIEFRWILFIIIINCICFYDLCLSCHGCAIWATLQLDIVAFQCLFDQIHVILIVCSQLWNPQLVFQLIKWMQRDCRPGNHWKVPYQWEEYSCWTCWIGSHFGLFIRIFAFPFSSILKMDKYSTCWLISCKGFCIISLMCCMWLCVQPSSWCNCCSSGFWLLSLVHILVCYGLIVLVSSFLNELSFYPQSFDQTILVLQVESLFMELQHVCAVSVCCVALTQLWAPELQFMKHIHLCCEVKCSNLPEKLQNQLCNGLIRPEGVWWLLWVPGCCFIFVFGNIADIIIRPRVIMPRCRSCAFRLATSLIFHILLFFFCFCFSSLSFWIL